MKRFKLNCKALEIEPNHLEAKDNSKLLEEFLKKTK